MITSVVSWHQPGTLAELLELLGCLEGPAHLLAGGTDIVAKAKLGLVAPGAWINIRGLPELSGIEVRDEELRLGALVTMTEVEASALLRAEARALWDACWVAGSVQIRNRATLGGNTANASPAGDTLPALMSLDAELELRSQRGRRRLPLCDFFEGPGRTKRARDEVITGFFVPRRAGSSGAFMRHGQRRAQAISKVSVGVTGTLDGGRVRRLAVAFGAVGPTVFRAREVEARALGNPLDPPLLEELVELARAAVRPISDQRSTAEYRREQAGVLLRRALFAFSSRASGSP